MHHRVRESFVMSGHTCIIDAPRAELQAAPQSVTAARTREGGSRCLTLGVGTPEQEPIQHQLRLSPVLMLTFHIALLLHGTVLLSRSITFQFLQTL